MILKEIEDRTQWNTIIEKQVRSELLLSWQWGEFQQTLGKSIKRYGYFSDTNQIVALFYTIEQKMPFNLTYLYSPRSPLILLKDELDKKAFLNEIQTLCTNSNAMFWRCNLLDSTLLSCELHKVEDTQPSKTLMLDLNHSEEDILKTVHHKTRYNIKVAQRNEVIVREATENDYATFINLLTETTKRDGFSAHPMAYYSKLLAMDNTFAKLMVGEYQGKILCAHLMTYFGDTVTYLHGASSNEDRNVMAPFLLQWECIREAKNRGFKYYDFWGIDEKKWPGVTRFKRNFVNENNGLEVSYPGTYDLICNKFLYSLYRIYKLVRKGI